MVLLLVFAVGVAVVQLGLLGSWTRSIRITTLFQAVAIGALVCAPVTVAIQWVVTRIVGAIGSSSMYQVMDVASWTYDPVVEEVLKLAPLVLLAWLWPAVHRRLGWTDHFLLGSASSNAAWQSTAPSFARPDWKSLVTWRTVLWLVAVMPGFVYLVVGGFPWTRPVQHAMAGTPGAIVLAVGTLAGVVVTASPMPALIRNLRSPFTPRWSDQRIREAGRLGVAAISVALGIFLVARLGTVRKGSQPIIITNHVLDAISGATIILGLALMVAAFIWFPPIGLAALEGGGTELVLTITAEFAKTLALGGVVTTMGGVMLDEAANSHPQSSSSGGNTNVSVSNQGAAGASQRTYGQFSEADLRAAAQSPDRHGLTRLGRALQKHSDRAGSAFSGESGGTPASRNEQGLRILDEILNDPNGRTEVLNSVINIWDSAGKGVRFSITGEFMGFLEPLP